MDKSPSQINDPVSSLKMDEEKLAKSQLRYRILKGSRRTLYGVLILVALVLMMLPFWNSFQDVLTRLVMGVGWYKSIQNIIVPYEIRVVSTILYFLGFPITTGQVFFTWGIKEGGNEVVYLAWNCVGWQTLVLFVITIVTGLSGKFTPSSKIETLLIGILGTYLVNIFRIVLVIIIYYWVGRRFGIVFHDYLSNLLTLGWLFFFWWFSYGFVLRENKFEQNKGNPE